MHLKLKHSGKYCSDIGYGRSKPKLPYGDEEVIIETFDKAGDRSGVSFAGQFFKTSNEICERIHTVLSYNVIRFTDCHETASYIAGGEVVCYGEFEKHNYRLVAGPTRVKNASQTLQTGDIIRLHHWDNGLHSGLYLGEGMYFERKGCGGIFTISKITDIDRCLRIFRLEKK